MKKLIGLVVLSLSVLFLVACSSENMDGTYYQYMESNNTLWKTGYVAKVEGDTLDWKDKHYNFNKDKKLIEGDSEFLSYSYKDDVLTLDGDDYVKVDSDKYKELIQKGAKVD